MELPEKIESNIVAYLQAHFADVANSCPDYFTPDMIHPGESDTDKTTQIIQAACGEADQEDPPFSGNYWHPVQIELRTPLYVQTDDQKQSSDDAQSTSQRDKHSAIASLLSGAILIDDFPAQINAAAQAQQDAELKAFALIGFLDRKPLREQNDNYIMSGFSLRVYACSNAAAA